MVPLCFISVAVYKGNICTEALGETKGHLRLWYLSVWLVGNILSVVCTWRGNKFVCERERGESERARVKSSDKLHLMQLE